MFMFVYSKVCLIAVGVAEHAVTALGFWQIWKLGGRHKRGTLLSVFFGGGLVEERQQGQGLWVRSWSSSFGLRQHKRQALTP